MKAVRAIHQLLSGFADGDAISHCAMVLRCLLLSWGIPSEIFVERERVSPAMRSHCRELREYQGRDGEAVIHHYGIASTAQQVYLQSPAHRILVYHNITPAEYYDGFDDSLAAQLRSARASLPDVVKGTQACWAVSRFNARELEAAGAGEVEVFPLVFDSAPLDRPAFSPVCDKFRTKLSTWLYVGRMAPNKRIETLIESFYWYHKTLNPYSRLVLVGSDRSCPRYYAMLRMLAGDFDLANVCFEGFAAPEGLPSYYRCADVFVTTSEHEGYCLPLLEAMHLGVPVVAQGIGGIPEALDGAGVLYQELKPAELAVLIHRIQGDAAVRAEILASQARRMETVRKRDLGAELRGLLTQSGLSLV